LHWYFQGFSNTDNNSSLGSDLVLAIHDFFGKN